MMKIWTDWLLTGLYYIGIGLEIGFWLWVGLIVVESLATWRQLAKLREFADKKNRNSGIR